MKRFLLTVSLFTAITAMYLSPAFAQVTLSNIPGNLLGFGLCHGTYALCAAAICTPTNGTIEVNTATGTAPFSAATCTCPVYKGWALADVNGGNMKGSCASPGPNQIWSLYSSKSNMPQQTNNWSHKPADTSAPFQLCAASDSLGASFANCFSFACSLDKKRQKGRRTATCICPLGENLNGTPVLADTAFLTPAGQCNSSVCGEYPVGMADPDLNSDSNECLGSPSDADNERLQLLSGN